MRADDALVAAAEIGVAKSPKCGGAPMRGVA